MCRGPDLGLNSDIQDRKCEYVKLNTRVDCRRFFLPPSLEDELEHVSLYILKIPGEEAQATWFDDSGHQSGLYWFGKEHLKRLVVRERNPQDGGSTFWIVTDDVPHEIEASRATKVPRKQAKPPRQV